MNNGEGLPQDDEEARNRLIEIERELLPTLRPGAVLRIVNADDTEKVIQFVR